MTQATEQLEQVVLPGTLLSTGLPKVDLLPPEIHAARSFRRLQLGLGAGVAAAAVVVGALWFVADAQVQSEQERLDAAQARQIGVTRQLRDLNDVADKYAQLDDRKELMSTAMGSEVKWSGYLNDLALRVPAGVWLKGMTVGPAAAASAETNGGIATISFTGSARTHNDVAVWLESLAKQRGYTNAYFTQSSEATDGTSKVVEFTSSVTVTSEALSNRYTNTGN